MSKATISGVKVDPLPPRRRPLRIADAELRRDRDRLIIQAVLRGDRTKGQIATQFGISRRALHKIEERVFRGKPSNPTRRWRRPDVKERARAPEEDVA